MRSLRKYEAKINKEYISLTDFNNSILFVKNVLIKGRIFLIDEFRDYLCKDLHKSDVSASACISRIKRIDKECLSKVEPIDVLLYIPFIMSTSNELAINVFEWLEKFLAEELLKRKYSKTISFPNRQFSDCKSALLKYKNFLKGKISEGNCTKEFKAGDMTLPIPKLSNKGIERINNQIKCL